MPDVKIVKYKVWYNIEVHYTVNGQEQEPFDIVSDEPADRVLDLAAMSQADINEAEVVEMIQQEQSI